MQPIETTRKRVSEIKTGTHLVAITDMYLLKDAMKQIQKIDGFPAIIVQFKNNEGHCHEQMYVVDEQRKKYLTKMLQVAQVPMDENGSAKKADAIGKRLWISICECHYIKDDVVVNNPDGTPCIDYFIFKALPFMEQGKKPIVKGDPELNNGIASEDFITYKQVKDAFTKEEIKEEPKTYVEAVKEIQKENEPSFTDEFTPKVEEVPMPSFDTEEVPVVNTIPPQQKSLEDEFNEVPTF